MKKFFFLLCRHDCINHCPLGTFVTSFARKKRCIMICNSFYKRDYFILFFRNYQNRRFLVALIQNVYNLSRCKLKNNRVQCLVPTKKNSEQCKQNTVSCKNIIPYTIAFFFCKINRNKISSAARTTCKKTKTDRYSVYNSAKYSTQNNIVSNSQSRNKICRKSRNNNH